MRDWCRLVRLWCLLLTLFAGLPAVSADDGVPRVVVAERSHDFGRVSRGTLVTKSFVIRNAGTAPLAIEGMQFSTPGMRARVASSIAPGASAELRVEWDTQQYTRDAEGEALLVLNDPEMPRLVLTMTGFVVSPIEVEPVPAFYLSQFQGESSAQTVTIRNNRERPLRITGTERQGNGFAIVVETVDPGRVYAVTGTADANLAPGEYHESALVFTDDPERPKIRLDVNILVKREIHASVETIDLGEVRAASVRANPSVLVLLRQTVILESRSAEMRVGSISSDLPFLELEHEPAGPARRVRIDAGIDPTRLRAGEYHGNVRIETGVQTLPVISLPVRIVVVD
jgi:hypothetical protein